MTAIAPGRLLHVPGPFAERFRALLWQRRWHVVAFTVLLAAVDYLRAFHLLQSTAGQPFVADAVEILSHWLLRSASLIAAITACEAAQLRSSVRWAAQGAAIVAVAAVNSQGLEVALFGDAQLRRLGLKDDGTFAYALWLQLASGAMLSWYYEARGRAAGIARLLAIAELDRQQARKKLVESRLEVLKAQVEPSFLHDTLERIQALYEMDGAHADAAMDDLIDYLRAALPQLRGRPPTLRQEVELVHAYLRIAARASGSAPPVVEAVSEAEADAYAPPMVLLPLAQIALEAGASSGGCSVFIVSTSRELGVRIECGALPCAAVEIRLAAVRRTLEALFGHDASVSCTTSGINSVITVTWPRIAARDPEFQ